MNEKIKVLNEYIKANVGPILVDFIDVKEQVKSVVLPANCSIDELNGHYESDKYCPPKWFLDLKSNSLLIIDNIDSIGKNEQMKFIELLKYRKISTFELPEYVRIIVTAKDVNKENINEEVYSLLVHI